MRRILSWWFGSVSEDWLKDRARFETQQQPIHFTIWLKSERRQMLRARSIQEWLKFSQDRQRRA